MNISVASSGFKDESDLLGDGGQSPLDRPIPHTTFPTKHGLFKKDGEASLRQLEGLLRKTVGAKKDDLPLISLSSYGNVTSVKKSFRHTDNILSVHGCEIDYDKGEMHFRDAVARLRQAAISCLVYKSPTSKPDYPKWRVLAPFSQACTLDEREQFTARINGVIGGGDRQGELQQRAMLLLRSRRGRELHRRLCRRAYRG